MDYRPALVQPGHLHRRPGGHHRHHVGVGGGHGFQQVDLALGQPHVGAVQALALADLVQANVEQDHVCLFRQLHGLGPHGRVALAGAGVSRLKSNYIQLIITDNIHGVVNPGGVDHGGARPLIPGLLGELADHGGLHPLVQGQEVPLVFQQDDGLPGGLLGQPVVGVRVEGLIPQRLDGPGDRQNHVQQLIHPAVNGLPADFPVLDGLDQLQVGVPPGGGHLQVGARPDALHMLVGAAPVGDDKAVEAPLVPQNLLEQVVILVGVDPVDPVVGGHEGLGPTLLDGDLKAGEVYLPQGALVHHRVGGHPPQLLGVAGEVLGAGGHPVFLDAPDIPGGHFARQIGVLGEILKVPAAQGAALDVQPRAQQDAHPLGCGLLPQALANLLPQGGVPGVGDGGGGGEAGGGQGGVQAQLVPRPRLLADAVGAVGQGHIADAQPLHAAGLPKVLAGEEKALLLQRHLLNDILVLHGKRAPLIKNIPGPRPFGDTGRGIIWNISLSPGASYSP